MSTQVRAAQYDTVDGLCYRTYGYTEQVVEQVLQSNPGLADLGPILPQGTLVNLPDRPRTPEQPEPVKLWD